MPQQPDSTPVVPPLRGLNDVVNPDQQPADTSPDEQNVRSYDAEGRQRLARRPGLTKWVDTDMGAAVQKMVKVVRSIAAPGTDGPPEDSDIDLTTPASDTTDMGDGFVQVTDLGNSFSGPASNTGSTRLAATDRLMLSGPPNGGGAGVVSTGKTTNKVVAAFEFNGDADASGSFTNDGPDDSCTRNGVFIRANTLLTELLAFYWDYVSTDTVVPKLATYINGTLTNIWTGSNESLDSSATQSTCTMTIEELSGTQVRVACSWDQITDFDETINTAVLNGSTNLRAGVMRIEGSNGITCELSDLTIEVLGEPAPGATVQSFASSDDNTVGGSQYFIPEGFVSFFYDASLDQFNGGAGVDTGPDDSSSEYDGVMIDTSSEFIISGNNVSSTSNAATGADAVMMTTAAEPSDRLAVTFTPTQMSTITEFFFGVYTRVSADYKSFVKILLSGDYNTSTNQYEIDTVSWATVSAGVKIADSDASPAENIILREGDALTISDNGPDGDTTITITNNGITHLSFTIPSASIDSGAAPGLYSSGVSSRRVGGGVSSTGQDYQGSIAFTQSGFDPGGSGGSSSEIATTDTRILAAVDGDIWTIGSGAATNPSGGAGALTSVLGRIQMQPAFNQVFMVDGTESKVYNLNTNAVTTWTATAGTLQTGARLLALYRGRIVMSGVQSDPHNWFMSAVGDPFDWDYSPTTPSATQAFAGNSADVGLIGDIVTALIPVSDDFMWIGCDHTIWAMTGDPAEGGAIDLVSDKTGMRFGTPWAKDPENVLYFLGVDGIYRMPPGQGPVNITRDRLRTAFRSVNWDANYVIMDWDFRRVGLAVHIVPTDGVSAASSFFYCARTDAWHPDAYDASRTPYSVLAYDGPGANDTQLLYGMDGYIRYVDDAAADDDGVTVTGYARFAPITDGPDREVALTKQVAILSKSSGAATLRAYAGATVEEAVESSTVRFSRTLAAGRNAAGRQRVRGNAIVLEMTGTSKWALESLSAKVIAGGMARRHAH